MQGVVRQLAGCAMGSAMLACVMSACRRGTDYSMLVRDAQGQAALAPPDLQLTGAPFLDTPVGSTLRMLLPNDFRYWSTASEPAMLLGHVDPRAYGANVTGSPRSWRVENTAQRATISTQP